MEQSKRIEGLIELIDGTVKKLVVETDGEIASVQLSQEYIAPNKRYRTVGDIASDFMFKYYANQERKDKNQYNFIPDWLLKLALFVPAPAAPSLTISVEDNVIVESVITPLTIADQILAIPAIEVPEPIVTPHEEEPVVLNAAPVVPPTLTLPNKTKKKKTDVPQ